MADWDFFSPVSGGVPGRRDGGRTVLHASAFETEEGGELTVAGGLFSCILGANSLVVTRLH